MNVCSSPTHCPHKSGPASLLVLQLIGQPVQALIEAVPAGSAGGLDVPVAVAQGVEAQLVGDLRCVHGIGQVLQSKRVRRGIHRRTGEVTAS